MFVFAKVEFAPNTPMGSLLRFSENPCPDRVDSAARESEAIGPALSSITGALGSVTWVNVRMFTVTEGIAYAAMNLLHWRRRMAYLCAFCGIVCRHGGYTYGCSTLRYFWAI